MLTKVKLALGITDSTFDSMLTAWIDAAKADLGMAGNTKATDTTNAAVVNAILTYCVMMHSTMYGGPANPDIIRKAYESQKAQMQVATGYTDWNDPDDPEPEPNTETEDDAPSEEDTGGGDADA